VSSRSHQLRRVARNLLATSAGQIVGAALNMATIVVIARSLGADAYGRYAYVLAFVGVFQLVASAGLERILVREIAVQTSDASRLLGAARSLTWALSVVTFLLIVAGSELTSPDPELRVALYLAGGAVLATIQAISYGGVFRALEQMEVNATAFVLHKVVMLALVLGAAWLGRGLIGMTAAFLVANLFLWMYYLAVLVRRHFRPRLRVDLPLWGSLLRDSLPVAVAAIVRRISWNVDVLILGIFGMTHAAGYFTASYKVVQALNLVPITLAQTLFPVLSRLARNRDPMLDEVLALALRFLGILAFPLALGLAVTADRVVALAYGPGFAPAAAPLAIMSLALLFMFWTSLYSFLFPALDRQRAYTIATAIGLAVNAGLDLLLVPRFAQVGASLGTLGGEIALFAAGSLLLRRAHGRLGLLRLAWRPLAAALAMGAVLVAVRGAALPVLAGGVVVALIVYGGLLVALRAVTAAEIAMLIAQVRRRRRGPGGEAAAEACEGVAVPDGRPLP
jgi:O-antigen/teichoic acid export membrane protein